MAKQTITESTRVSLKLLIGVVVCTVAVTTAWYDLRSRLTAMQRDLNEVIGQQWSPMDDRLFMLEFAGENDLRMVPHAVLSEISSGGTD